MTISGVAKETGVSNALIHNFYADLADRIRKSKGDLREKSVKEQLANRIGKIKEEKVKRAKLRKELGEIKLEIQKVDSINAALQIENNQLKSLNQKYLKEINRLKGPSVVKF